MDTYDLPHSWLNRIEVRPSVSLRFKKRNVEFLGQGEMRTS